MRLILKILVLPIILVLTLLTAVLGFLVALAGWPLSIIASILGILSFITPAARIRAASGRRTVASMADSLLARAGITPRAFSHTISHKGGFSMDMGIELSPLCGMVICIIIAAFFALWGAGLLIVRLRQRRKRSP